MSEFTLYTFSFPSRAERVSWCLNELGLDYETIKLDPFKGETFTHEGFKQASPLKKMPALVHHRPEGDVYLYESLAINEYLNNYAKGQLVPKSTDEQYAYDRAMFYGVTELEAYLWVANQATVLDGIYHWPKEADKEALKQVERALPQVLNWLKSQNYIAGNSFTLADIFYHQLMVWFKHYQIPLPAYAEQYIARLEARPAFQAIQ